MSSEDTALKGANSARVNKKKDAPLTAAASGEDTLVRRIDNLLAGDLSLTVYLGSSLTEFSFKSPRIDKSAKISQRMQEMQAEDENLADPINVTELIWMLGAASYDDWEIRYPDVDAFIEKVDLRHADFLEMMNVVGSLMMQATRHRSARKEVEDKFRTLDQAGLGAPNSESGEGDEVEP